MTGKDNMLSNINTPHENSLWLMPVRPGMFIALWDFSTVREKRMRSGEFEPLLRINLFNSDGKCVQEQLFPWNDRKAYISHEPSAGYFRATIYLKGVDGWVILCESNKALSPATDTKINNMPHSNMERYQKKAGK